MSDRRVFLAGIGAVALFPNLVNASSSRKELVGTWSCVMQDGFGKDEHLGATFIFHENGAYDWNSQFRTKEFSTQNFGVWETPTAAELKLVSRGKLGRVLRFWRDDKDLWQAFAEIHMPAGSQDAMVLQFSSVGGWRHDPPAVLGFERQS